MCKEIQVLSPVCQLLGNIRPNKTNINIQHQCCLGRVTEDREKQQQENDPLLGRCWIERRCVTRCWRSVTRCWRRVTRETKVLPVAALLHNCTGMQHCHRCHRQHFFTSHHYIKCYVILSTYRVFFLTGTPPKNSKYKKVNLGKVRCI